MDTNGSSRLSLRLRSAQGHLQAVIRQVETMPAGEETLAQLDAVRAALQAAEKELCLSIVCECMERIKTQGDPETLQADLKKLVHLYYFTSSRY